VLLITIDLLSGSEKVVKQVGVQAGGVGGHEGPVLDAENSQGRESFLDDEDTENVTAAAECVQAGVSATSGADSGAQAH
jgi:hypothetical protein